MNSQWQNKSGAFPDNAISFKFTGGINTDYFATYQIEGNIIIR